MKRVIKQAKGEITLQEAFDLFIQEKEAMKHARPLNVSIECMRVTGFLVHLKRW